MKLLSVQVTNFKCILDSGEVPVGDITALVGKNESGKSAFLQALHLFNPLNPIVGKTNYNDVTDYPTAGFSKYSRTSSDKPAVVVKAKFQLSDDELSNIGEAFGSLAMASNHIAVSKGYGGPYSYEVDFKNEEAIKFVIGKLNLSEDQRKLFQNVKNGGSLLKTLLTLPEPDQTVTELIVQLGAWRDSSPKLFLIDHILHPVLPKFFYFDDYSVMRGKISLDQIISRESTNTLDEPDRAFLSLIGTAQAKLGDFNVVDYEERKRQLEATANVITEDVFKFWSQNKDLRVTFEISAANPQSDPPLNSGQVINIRILNSRNFVSVPFDQRSRGFVWFFSFFAYFSNLKIPGETKVILLLDEPGVSLHAKAQNDFLNLIENKLAPERQVIYTTHSPFMIDPQRLDRVRTVEDTIKHGTKVKADVLGTDSDTVFPLQAALGYELAQTLFIGPNSLLVEGPSEYLYLPLLSLIAEINGLELLSPKWVITPVGGAGKVATFISLLSSNNLNIAVLLDSKSGDQQKIQNMQNLGYIRNRSLIRMSEFTNKADSDIEDLFPVGFYLDLVNGAYGIEPPILESDLISRSPRIVVRVEEVLQQRGIGSGSLNHMKPASYFLENQSALIPKLDQMTILTFSTMFSRINKLLKSQT